VLQHSDQDSRFYDDHDDVGRRRNVATTAAAAAAAEEAASRRTDHILPSYDSAYDHSRSASRHGRQLPSVDYEQLPPRRLLLRFVSSVLIV